MKEFFTAFLINFKWFRRMVGGKWYYVRLDLCDRPCYWVQVPNNNETIILEEN